MNIHLYSLHGLLCGGPPELGRDADNGGQIVYVLELARQLSRHPEVQRVTLITRLIEDPQLDTAYAQPVEQINEKFTIRRIPFGGKSYLLKEHLWPHLPEFIAGALAYVQQSGDIPDVIHGHYADAGLAGAEVASRLGVPFVHTGHSLGRPKLTRLLADGMDEGEAMRVFRFAERFAAEERTLAEARFIVTSSTQEISTYADYANAAKARCEVIPPGVDFRRFRPYYQLAETPGQIQARLTAEHSLGRFLREPNKPLILAVCRADRKKNIETLVRAYGTDPVLQALANLAVLVGLRQDIKEMLPGPASVLENLLHLQDRYNLYGRLAMPKRHEPVQEVPELYRLAAERRGVFVNVALTEPFGLTLLEAAASGLPVVATNDGGPAEIVPNCGNGVLVPPTDVAAIQAALRDILSDEERWLAYSHTGVRRVSEHYNWERHVERYVELLQRTAGPVRQGDSV